MGNHKDNDFSKGVILGAIIGATAGAVTALLFAPKSGKELRQDIATKSGEIYENVGEHAQKAIMASKEKAQDIIQAARRQAETIIKGAEKIVSDTRQKAIDAKETVVGTYDSLREATKAGVEAFKDEMKSGSSPS